MLKDILSLKPVLRLPPITNEISSAILISFLDASHGGKEFDYGQTGGVTGVRINKSGDDRGILYRDSWSGGKKRRI